MITDKEIWAYEKSNLETVVDEIKIQLDNGIHSADKYKKDAIELQKEMWEDAKCMPSDLFDLEGATQIWQYQTSLSNQARKYKFAYDTVGRLERMYHSPYFGRIDFWEDGEPHHEKIYIGIHTLSKPSTGEILIYDWRAPISGMFYDFETGLCSYQCPAGTIRGQMLLKRQYKIENRNILYMFDSSLSINDEMLREILGKSTDSRMKTIVTSIQREQNTVIRNSADRILIVEGPAGSGKTSIALHRAAYLLYKYRQSIKSENILIFSPNHVFEDYISSVLPELGEENIRRSTFTDFFGPMLDAKYHLKKVNEQMEYILSAKPEKIRLSGIKLKASPRFLAMLKAYVQQLEKGRGLKFNDLVYNGTLIISAEEIHRLFSEDYSMFAYAKRLDKLCQRLFYLLDQYEENRVRQRLENASQQSDSVAEEKRVLSKQKLRAELELLKNNIFQMTAFDVHQLYKNFLECLVEFAQYDDARSQMEDKRYKDELESIGTYTIYRLAQGIVNYEDAAPLIFLKTVLDAPANTKAFKHVIVDEAQDYTVIQYEILKVTFGHCNMTILGDLNQSVNGYMNIGSFDNISGVFDEKQTKSISLTKSYRSSKEIADFCNAILMGSNPPEQLNRHGNKPKIMKIDRNSLPLRIVGDIRELKNRNHKLIAVICKTAEQCKALYQSVRSHIDISLISNQNEVYGGDVVIIPSYLAKGLEFDAVLVNSVEATVYGKAEDRKVLYTVCTRALHELYLYYADNMSGFIQSMDEDLYAKG